jgi:hypothetical protein
MEKNRFSSHLYEYPKILKILLLPLNLSVAGRALSNQIRRIDLKTFKLAYIEGGREREFLISSIYFTRWFPTKGKIQKTNTITRAGAGGKLVKS